jgi:phenylalanine-4-hydroxylase
MLDHDHHHTHSSTAVAPSTRSHFIEQKWSEYTAEQHDVWSILYDRRMRSLQETASRVFLEGSATIGLARDRVPDLANVNVRLGRRTTWAAVPVDGFLPAKEFFSCLAVRRFPTTVIVRSREQLDYLPEPDIFHDVFGHVPLHADPVFADFLQRFGQAASRARTEEQTQAMARLFWFTVEFGLIRERGEVKIYGSGLISSQGDAANALAPACDKRRFVLRDVLAQPFEIDHFQNILFVLDSFDQLFEAVVEATTVLALGSG